MINEYGFEIPLVSEEECKLQKRIAELEEQIEKMKCCDNCANEDREEFYDDTWHNDVCVNCKNHDKWELRK